MMGFENREQRAKRVMKDVIFTEAFKEKKNILELYNQLHADDTTDNEDDIGVLTLRSILVHVPRLTAASFSSWAKASLHHQTWYAWRFWWLMPLSH